jgi:hypothetical protein
MFFDLRLLAWLGALALLPICTVSAVLPLVLRVVVIC